MSQPEAEGHPGREAPLLVCEESWMARVEILTSLCERMLTTFRALGHPRTGFEAELRDLTEEEAE